jgi:hypothetical protein
MNLVCNAMMQETTASDIITKCTDDQTLLDYIHDVEQMVEIRVDARITALSLVAPLDYADEIIGRVYIMNMLIMIQESHDLTKDAKIVMLNVARTLAQGLQSLVADAEGCDWMKRANRYAE